MTETSSPPILRLLGGALIESNAEPLGGPGAHRHRLALLALLALSRRPMSRDKLMAYLWPERDIDSARGLLRTVLYETRKLLGEGVLRRTGDSLSIEPAFLRCDVLEFEAAVAANDVDAALALYAGPFLDGFHIKEAAEFERWIDDERLRLERLHERVMAQPRRIATPTIAPAVVETTEPATQELITSESTNAAANARAEKTRDKRTLTRWLGAGLGAAVLVVALILGARFSKATEAAGQPVLLPDTVAGWALEFAGGADASTQRGMVVTTHVDDIAVDLLVRYDVQHDKDQILFYNGNSRVSGWGIMVLGAEERQPNGTLAVLAGGVKVMATPLVLQRGVWQHVTVERRHGQFAVTLDDSTFLLAPLVPNPVGARDRDIEHTSVGGDGYPEQPNLAFFGAVDRVRIRDLASGYWIERWFFDDAKGSAAIGKTGTAMRIGTARWIAGPRLARQDVFWSRLQSLCGQAFGGQVGDSAAVLHFFSCAPNEIQMGVGVGVDRSRVVVVTKRGTDFHLLAAHRRPDGTEDRDSDVAGDASLDSADSQEFRDASRANIVRIDVKLDSALSYVRSARGAERERMTFNLIRQVAIPPLPWGAKP